jgi:murein L,D-transpeptidase YcbB/YkuD
MTHSQKTLGFAAAGLVLILMITAVFFRAHEPERKTFGATLPAAIMRAVGRNANDQARDIYRARSFAPIWIAGESLSEDARFVIALLSHAGDQGLPKSRYTFIPAPPKGAGDRAFASFEISLTRAALTYAHDMKFGMLRPATLFEDVSLPKRTDDTVAKFQEALQGNVAEYLKSLEPPGPYAVLKQALLRYRALSAHPWPEVRTKDDATLAARLAAEGYGRSGADVAGARTPVPALRDALKDFQTANGLDADGKLDDKTLTMLNISPGERAQQIAANMERWRWLPRDLGQRYVMVNVAGASLALVENGEAAITSRAVVGAPDKPTPILATEAVAITLNPVWHLPKSIIKNEIEPKLADDSDYLERKGMERTDDGDIIQRPGPQNALGTVKFEMPNNFDVYMHDTPSKRAFLSDERTLSHGCVRVERITELAQHILGVQEDELKENIASGETSRQPIKPPVPVYIQYWTAVPREGNQVGFRPDVYQRDARMIAALDRNAHLASAR